MQRPARPSGLRASLLVLAAIVAVALIGLGFAGNWPKVLRVALASGTYAALLLAFTRKRAEPVLGAFVAAGAAAGLVSGIVRTTTSPGVIVAGSLGAALLLGPLHWWALRTWRRQDG